MLGIPQRALPFCGPCSGGVHVPLSVVAYVGMFIHTGGDLRRTLGRSAWMTVVTGSEWEVPPRLSALRGNVPMSVWCGVKYSGRHVVMHVCVGRSWAEMPARPAEVRGIGRIGR